MKRFLGLSAAALFAFSPLEAAAEEEANDRPSSAEETRIRRRCEAVGEKVRDRIQQTLNLTGFLLQAAREAGEAGRYAEKQCLRKNGLQPLRPKTEKKPEGASSGNQSTRIIF